MFLDRISLVGLCFNVLVLPRVNSLGMEWLMLHDQDFHSLHSCWSNSLGDGRCESAAVVSCWSRRYGMLVIPA
ncbi:hypothetical protein BDV26DRAFT_271622 [Aspergillus bertholletiae]|uniref:Uncharacterized protein n=1 Tax=Aspergillus bertholletiae TaxID=1226010 RepID=A0A5N7AUW4_9EURO|nr:hypothetical protein BDV26DRAFT_271622 [Aspergillus bertholletiae]